MSYPCCYRQLPRPWPSSSPQLRLPVQLRHRPLASFCREILNPLIWSELGSFWLATIGGWAVPEASVISAGRGSRNSSTRLCGDGDGVDQNKSEQYCSKALDRFLSLLFHLDR